MRGRCFYGAEQILVTIDMDTNSGVNETNELLIPVQLCIGCLAFVETYQTLSSMGSKSSG